MGTTACIPLLMDNFSPVYEMRQPRNPDPWPTNPNTKPNSEPSLTFHPDAYCCDWCHSKRTWNAVAGKWTWRSGGPPGRWAAAAGGSRPGRWGPRWSWHCAAGGDWGWATPPRASSSCRFDYRPTWPKRCSSLGGSGSCPSAREAIRDMCTILTRSPVLTRST